MGRYYNGDIEGKFWFGVQSSDSADRFGVTGEPPSSLIYYFDKSNLSTIEEELKVIEQKLGNKLELLNKFFEEKESYNDEEIIQYLKDNGVKIEIPSNDNLVFFCPIQKILSEYADYELGCKIKKCVEETGSCSFDAEF